MQPLPTPCPADQVPDATAVEAFNAAHKQAKRQNTVSIAVENQGRHWTVKADALTTCPDHTVVDDAYDAIRSAVIRLIRAWEIRSDSSAGPVYFVLYNVKTEGRARELAAALHAALYGDLAPLTHAVPETSP
ncbi:hypothetical protein [Streptomyces sp. PU_AKi4]|uniref:hypothetical protein n=1 Tax=Streptomyces sp. PU_AKi4 TaxID=2800809 RepID=UPI0035252C41